MERFNGSYHHSLDAKSRLFIPAQFRKRLGGEDSDFVIMKSPEPEKCLFIYPQDEWEQIEAKLDEMSPGAQNRNRYRLIYSRIDVQTLDKQGRIALKEDFCSHAELDKNVLVLGAGRRIEIWSEEEWNKMTQTTQEEDFDFDSIPW